ncbi:MAG: alpha/beta fold hydrolase [Acidobacteria bacterium]|nr:alpha/beta fold hydrolase [Acidobacteriota bacterium]
MRRLLGCLFLLILATPLFGQLADIPDSALLLKVTVVDGRNRPIAGADVAISSQPVGLTDETGTFYYPRKPLAPGDYPVSAGHAGFKTRKQTVTIPAEASQLPVKVRIQLERQAPPSNVGQQAPNYRIYQLFYATDRKSTKSKDPETYYSADRNDNGQLELGVCDVSVPVTHQKGVLESPSIFRLEFQYDPEKHVVMRLPTPTGADPFYEKLSARVKQSTRKEAFVFIHGYNTTFADAARKAVQLAADLSFDGAPILYSWPSMGQFRGYFSDEKNVAWSVPHLDAFLAQVAERSGATRIHLIAHSMGNRAMTGALKEIGKRRTGPKFQQIVLAAPDIRVNQIRQLEEAMLPLAHRVTLYASRNDDALILARIIDGIARAGENINDVVVPGIDAVDASAVRTDFIGHGYFAASTSVISDLRQLLHEDAAPQTRRLLPAKLANLLYWVIPASAPAQ